MHEGTDMTRAAGPGGTAGMQQAQDIDLHVGARIRLRRAMLGLSQQQLAELIGVTYQQAHKYEKGINRIAAGRLFTIAQALGVDVGHFFEGMNDKRALKLTPQERMLLQLARTFFAMPSTAYQEALCNLARVLATPNPSRGEGAMPVSTRVNTPGNDDPSLLQPEGEALNVQPPLL